MYSFLVSNNHIIILKSQMPDRTEFGGSNANEQQCQQITQIYNKQTISEILKLRSQTTNAMKKYKLIIDS